MRGCVAACYTYVALIFFRVAGVWGASCLTDCLQGREGFATSAAAAYIPYHEDWLGVLAHTLPLEVAR